MKNIKSLEQLAETCGTHCEIIPSGGYGGVKYCTVKFSDGDQIECDSYDEAVAAIESK